jgi:hypothetical protein
MEASKVKNGSRLRDILVIGRKTARMASEFNFTKMETSTKGCGKEISVTVKEPIGETKLEN